jgi:hypothetical protein
MHLVRDKIDRVVVVSVVTSGVSYGLGGLARSSISPSLRYSAASSSDPGGSTSPRAWRPADAREPATQLQARRANGRRVSGGRPTRCLMPNLATSLPHRARSAELAT